MSEPNKRPRVASRFAAQFAHLRDHGYCVIENLVPAERCWSYKQGLDRYFISAGVNLTDQTTVQADVRNIHGIIQGDEVGHCDAVCRARQDEAVLEVFEEMWGDNDLLVSMDGVSIMLDTYRGSSKTWLHVDQSHGRPGRRCIQGYLNLVTSHDAGSGSLAVVPDSHLKHTEFGNTHPGAKNNTADWYKFTAEDLDYVGAEYVRVHGGVGSLVLWDSRTAHQNVPPSLFPARPRYIIYLCYQPRDRASSATIRKRIKAYDEYRMSTNWPADRFILFPAKMWDHGANRSKTTNPVRDRVETQRLLELMGKSGLKSKPRQKTTPALEFVK